MQDNLQSVRENIAAFRRKYYINLALRGSLLTGSILGGYFLLAAVVEYVAWLSPLARFLIFFLFFALSVFSVFYFLRSPLLWWLRGIGLSEEEAARLIGKNFPEVNDRLLNILQLATQSTNDLAAAGILQKSSVVQKFSFASSINLNVNRSYAKYFALALSAFLLILIFNKSILTESTQRIIHFNKEYTPAAPFSFHLPPQDLRAYFNEDHTIHLRLSGSAIPQAAYLVLPNQRIKMTGSEENFSHTFEKLQQPLSFQIEAAGYFSPSYKIEILHRPELLSMNTAFYFPAYLHRPSSSQSNVGAITIPEGTRVLWNIETQNASHAVISFGGVSSPLHSSNNSFYTFEKSFKNPSRYSISLFNDDSRLKDSVAYPISVIKDAHPQIVVHSEADSVLFKSIFLGGVISDDYAVSKLELIYSLSSDGKAGEEKKMSIPIFSNRQQQNFVYRWRLDSLALKPNQQINYSIQVWDNDGVNGPKATRSASYSFQLPSAEEMKTSVSKSENATRGAFEKSLEKTKTIKDAIKTTEEKIRTKRQLDWQDKKALEDLLKQKQALDQQVQELQKQNELLEQKQSDVENERIKEKAEQLQQLMKDLLDDQTKELFKKLEELLNKNADPKSVQDVLKKMDKNEMNLEKELERAMELFKQLQRDFKFEQSTQDLHKNMENQKNLMEETEKKEKGESEKTESELSKEQEKVKEEFKDFEKSLEELKKPDSPDIPSNEKTEEVEKSMDDSKKELDNKKSRESKAKQKEAVQKMQEMEKEMRDSQAEMEMEMEEENMELLKQILHGLINLSFEQESLAKNFGKVEQSDPQYLKLSEKQLDLKNDIEVLEDSLVSLAKKDAFLSNVVSRKLSVLNEHFDKSILQIKERNQYMATGEMQFSMAAINDLALLLNEHFEMLMNMKQQKGKGKGKGKKGKGDRGPSLSQLQKKLNEQINELQKRGDMPGRQLSEELARMAAEQERIRHALEKMQEKLLKEGGKLPGGDIPGKMEQTELDLVNKKLTEETVRRQQQIVTRLLETENSMREREQDQERKGETAKKYNAAIPKSFEEYFKLKEKEIELIKTLPPKLQPFYKNEVNKYFERLGSK